MIDPASHAHAFTGNSLLAEHLLSRGRPIERSRPHSVCVDRCIDASEGDLQEFPSAQDPPRHSGDALAGPHRVEMAVSSLLGLGGVVGYHTSVLVDGTEFFFEEAGIRGALADSMLGLKTACGGSHSSSPMRVAIGSSHWSGRDLVEFLEPHFKSGTYDLLRKNCNSFTRCALYLLCGVRLHKSYCAMERIGSRLGLEFILSFGGLDTNPAAEGFQIDDVIAAIDDLRKAQSSRVTPSALRGRSKDAWSSTFIMSPLYFQCH